MRRIVTGLLFVGLTVAVATASRIDDPDAPPTPVPPAGKAAAKDAKLPNPDEIADPENPDKKYPSFEKLTKGAKVSDGLFTLHLKDDTLLAEIKQDQFDKPFMMPIAIAKGGGTLGGETRNFGEEWVIAFKKVGDKVFVIRRNVRYTAKAGTPAAKAVETAYTDSVLLALPIKTINPAKSTVVVDFNEIFFHDFAQLGLGTPDVTRTTWQKVKALKKNVELQLAATYAGGRSFSMFGFGGGTDGVIDERGVTLVLHYGLIELPDGYTPRLADDRVGHFLTAVKDYSKDGPDTAFVRMVQRWRLERADGSEWKTGAKLVPPKKKIIYWIENSVPEEFREPVREGILEWNKAFEKIGFKNAIEVRQQEGEEFDPEDVTYSTFRWTAHDGGFAIGPSRANPLTGEIIDADILFDGSFLRFYREETRLFRNDDGKAINPPSGIQASHRGWDLPVGPLAFRNSPFRWNDRSPMTPEMRAWQRINAARNGYCRCAGHKRDEFALAIGHLAAIADVKDGAKIPEDLLLQGVKEVTMHEVGHTLGLRHNFKASAMLPNDKLHDKKLAETKGLVGSVMDYTPANIAPKGTPQGYYFTPTIGPYDYWAIEYAYKPLTGGTDGEVEELKKIASKAATPDLMYGTDEDVFGTSDPRINRFDLGAEPLQFGKDRIKLAKELIAKLAEKGVDDGESYHRVRTGFGLALGQYGNAGFLAAKYIGGVATHRDHKGDPNGRDPFIPVKADQQREALAFLKDTILTANGFDFPPELLRKLAADRWYHWGNEMSLFRGVDINVNEQILSIHTMILDELLAGDVLGRVQHAARTAAKDEKPLTVAEIFRAMSDSALADLPTADGKASTAKSSVVQRNLQRAYLAKLSEIVLGPKASNGGFFFIIGGRASEVPADAKSLARFHLKEAAKRIDAALKTEADDTVKAHLDESKERIAKVLAAQVTANEP